MLSVASAMCHHSTNVGESKTISISTRDGLMNYLPDKSLNWYVSFCCTN